MMTTYGTTADHTPLPNDVFTWAGSYNERSLVLEVSEFGESPYTRTMRTVGTSSMGDTYDEQILASGPGWVVTICDNFDPKSPAAPQVEGDRVHDVLNLGYLGQSIVYPIRRPLRPGEIGSDITRPEPSEFEWEEIRSRAVSYIEFIASHGE